MSEMTYVLMGMLNPTHSLTPRFNGFKGFNGFNFSPVADKTFNTVLFCILIL